jgi:hypothetical protein
MLMSGSGQKRVARVDIFDLQTYVCGPNLRERASKPLIVPHERTI